MPRLAFTVSKIARNSKNRNNSSTVSFSLGADLRERQMTVTCHISIDGTREADELAFQELPRVGESVSMPIEGSNRDLRVLRVIHMPGGDHRGHTMLELTSKIL